MFLILFLQIMYHIYIWVTFLKRIKIWNITNYYFFISFLAEAQITSGMNLEHRHRLKHSHYYWVLLSVIRLLAFSFSKEALFFSSLVFVWPVTQMHLHLMKANVICPPVCLLFVLQIVALVDTVVTRNNRKCWWMRGWINISKFEYF